jgi:hypothetical protein
VNTTTALADLDELVLLCRDDKARLYIVEAVACYRSGAYRSAIVATWIAVCYDIIDKLRELSLSGDNAAAQHIATIERARAANDFMSSLKVERELLVWARDQFEFISHLEYIDLFRLHEDRNRCAHPSLVSQDQGFNPPGELARLHIRSAVLHLLQHQPAQGKYALERLVAEARSEYFPRTTQKAVQALSSGPLKRPRDSLIRNFVIILIKDIFTLPSEINARHRTLSALKAVSQLHPRSVAVTLEELLPSLFRALSDDALHLGVWLLIYSDDYWDVITRDVQLKLEGFVEALPSEHFELLVDMVLSYAPLRKSAELRAGRASRDDFRGSILFGIPAIVADRCIDLYLQSGNFADANEWSSEIRTYAVEFSADQQRGILAGIAANDQVRNSNTVGSVIVTLRQTNKLSPEEFERILEKNGLHRHMR